MEENFNNFLKKELNKEQYQAVTHKKGAILVIAGAGSGKTRVIISRIVNLIINEKVNPKSIVALTFTNKAANEMKERLFDFLENEFELPFVGTFHSYCLLLLRTNPHLLPYPKFSILDEDDKNSLLKKILKKYGLGKQVAVTQLNSYISGFKNNLENLSFLPVFKELFFTYEKEKSTTHCLDFDDLLLVVLNLLKKNKEFQNRFQEKIKHILIDEYQDTNKVQHSLLKNLALKSDQKLSVDSICAVGDADQSIYSWRGAIVENMFKFKDDFSPVIQIKIEQNYRTVQPILKAANKVIANNKMRNEKKLWSTKKASRRILILTNRSDYQEAITIATFLKISTKNKKDNSFAILYRTHFQSRVIEEELVKSNLHYLIVGGVRFYQRKEIKDLLAYMRLVANPFDRVSFFRIINYPHRSLGDQFERLLLEEWETNPLFDFKQILKHLLDHSTLPLKKKQSVLLFLEIFKNLQEDQNPSFVINKIIEKTSYLNVLRKSLETKETETKIENIQELLRAIDHFENKPPQNNTKFIFKNNNLEDFLGEISLMEEKLTTSKKEPAQIKMMTLHAAKGLEFDTVTITGLEEGLFPSSRSLNLTETLEEERRLFYVGMTRAKERLILSHAQQRNSFGQICTQIKSRFLEEVPKSLTKNINISNEFQSQIPTLFSNWLENKKDTGSSIFFGASLPPLANHSKKSRASTSSISKISKTLWKKNQPVSHKSFGIGIIKKAEQKENGEFFITAKFKKGEKKLLSSFLKLV